MKKLIIFSLLFVCSNFFLGQEKKEHTYNIQANINVNNNGISWIPIYTLGKPSIISDIKFSINNFSVNPRFRFDIEDLQPWNIDINFNYKFKQGKKINFELGTLLPATTFQKFFFQESSGQENNRLTPWVYVFINPKLTAKINKNFKLRISYFEGFPTKIVSEFQPRKGRTVFLQPILNKIKLGKKSELYWMPQFYFTQVDQNKGYYYSQNLQFGLQNSSFRLTTSFNKAINTNLRGEDFDWNFGITYRFNKNLFSKQEL